MEMSPRSPVLVWLLAVVAGLLATGAGAQDSTPILAFPDATTGGASGTYYYINLTDGKPYVVDGLSRDPLNLRSQALEENLFQVIGRPAGQAAYAGEIFFAPLASNDGSVRAGIYVETAIGYVAFFEEPGRGRKLGKIITVIGRPFESIMSMDGNYALMPRRDTSGRTEGAYLYHATSGRGLYLGGLRKLEPSVKARPTSDLPVLAGRVTTAEIHVGSEASGAYLVADPASGEVYYLRLLSGAATQVTPQKTPVQLYDVFSREGSHTSARRFLAVPVNSGRSRTEQIFIADAVTGETAVLVGVTDGDVETRLVKAAPVNRWLRDGGGERVFSAVPHTSSSGATLGIWLIDSQSRSTVYIDNPGQPGEMTTARVTVERR